MGFFFVILKVPTDDLTNTHLGASSVYSSESWALPSHACHRCKWQRWRYGPYFQMENEHDLPRVTWSARGGAEC